MKLIILFLVCDFIFCNRCLLKQTEHNTCLIVSFLCSYENYFKENNAQEMETIFKNEEDSLDKLKNIIITSVTNQNLNEKTILVKERDFHLSLTNEYRQEKKSKKINKMFKYSEERIKEIEAQLTRMETSMIKFNDKIKNFHHDFFTIAEEEIQKFDKAHPDINDKFYHFYHMLIRVKRILKDYQEYIEDPIQILTPFLGIQVMELKNDFSLCLKTKAPCTLKYQCLSNEDYIQVFNPINMKKRRQLKKIKKHNSIGYTKYLEIETKNKEESVHSVYKINTSRGDNSIATRDQQDNQRIDIFKWNSKTSVYEKKLNEFETCYVIEMNLLMFD